MVGGMKMAEEKKELFEYRNIYSGKIVDVKLMSSEEAQRCNSWFPLGDLQWRPQNKREGEANGPEKA